MIDRAEIIKYVRSLIGTPFRHQGRLPGVALDCLGVLIVTGWHFGMKPRSFDHQGYGRQPDGSTMLEECDKHMQRISKEDIREGDVVVMRFDRDPQHVAVVANHPDGGLSIIHAYQPPGGGGKVVEHRLAPHIYDQIVAAYRLPGVA